MKTAALRKTAPDPNRPRNEGDGFHPARAPEILFCGYITLRFWTWSEDQLAAPFWRWYWNDDPGAYLACRDRKWLLNPNSVVLVPPQTLVSSHTTKVVKHFFLHFTLPQHYRVSPPEPLVFDITKFEQDLIYRFQTAPRLTSAVCLIERSLVSNLLIQIALSRLPSTCWQDSVSDPRVARVLERLQQPDGIKLSNEDLAGVAGLSVSAFSHLFTRSVGEAPHRYLLRQRLTQACQLLHKSSLTLDDIAEKAGFCDRFHFSRVFREHFKVPPAAFRKNCFPFD